MIDLFYIQLLVSFIVGGGFIALVTFFAERAPARAAGLVLALPTTIALGFFFLGWTVSAPAVAEVVPSTLIPLGLSIIFPAIYVYVAGFVENHIHKKIPQIVVSYTLSIGVWLLLGLPVAFYKLNNLAIGLVVYGFLTTLSHWLLNRRSYAKEIPVSYSTGQKIGRVVFAGLIIALVVYFGKTLDPFWGGLFTMFPAALSSSLVILHYYYNAKGLFPTIQKFALGSLTLLVYTMTVMYVFPVIGFALGSVVAYAASLLTSILLYKIRYDKSPHTAGK